MDREKNTEQTKLTFSVKQCKYILRKCYYIIKDC